MVNYLLPLPKKRVVDITDILAWIQAFTIYNSALLRYLPFSLAGYYSV